MTFETDINQDLGQNSFLTCSGRFDEIVVFG